MNRMGENILTQVHRRSLGGGGIRGATVLCGDCPRYLGYSEYHLQMCEHVFFARAGFRNIMWNILCDNIGGEYEVATELCNDLRYFLIF